MEGVAAEVADGAQGAALVGGHDALRRVLDDLEAVAGGNVHDGVHLAGDAGVVDGHDGAGPVGDGVLELCLVDVHGIRTDVDKDGGRAGQDDGGGGAGEVERGRPAGGQQGLLGAEPLLEKGVALFGELAVAADLVGVDGLLHICQFCPDKRRNIKRNHSLSASVMQMRRRA